MSVYKPGIVVMNGRAERHVWVNDHLQSEPNAVIMMTGIIWATKHPLNIHILPREEPDHAQGGG